MQEIITSPNIVVMCIWYPIRRKYFSAEQTDGCGIRDDHLIRTLITYAFVFRVRIERISDFDNNRKIWRNYLIHTAQNLKKVRHWFKFESIVQWTASFVLLLCHRFYLFKGQCVINLFQCLLLHWFLRRWIRQKCQIGNSLEMSIDWHSLL